MENIAKMVKFSDHDTFMFIVLFAVIYWWAKLFGEIFRRLWQPAVVWEIISWIILWPTILQVYFPWIFDWLFTSSPNATFGLHGIVNFSVLMLLFVVWLEIEVEKILKQWKSVAIISATWILIPALLWAILGWFTFWMFSTVTVENQMSQAVFALFIWAAFSISALPVIARVLLDLDLLKTKIWSLIIAVSAINDIVWWILFTIVLWLAWGSEWWMSISAIIACTMVLAIASVSFLKPIMHKIFDLVYKATKSNWAIIWITLVFVFLFSLLTEYIWIHAVFWAFMMWIAVNSSSYFTHEMKEDFMKFVTFILAPMFFGTVWLKANFFNNFDLTAVLLITVWAYITKMLAWILWAKLSKLSFNEWMAIWLGITARWWMWILLAVISYNSKIINDWLFSALIIMAVVTSMTSGLIKNYTK